MDEKKKSAGLQNVTQPAGPDEGETSVPLNFRVLVFCRHQDLTPAHPHLSKPIQKQQGNSLITAKITARKTRVSEERTANSRQNGKEMKL